MQRPALPAHAHWWVLAVGLAGLYIPSLWDLAQGLWASPEQGHGPIVLAVALWLIYRQWPALMAAQATTRPSAWGWLHAVSRGTKHGHAEAASPNALASRCRSLSMRR